MHLWLNFFCRDLTCIVYFKCNAYIRMTIYSSLSSFLHSELLSDKFETPDVLEDHGRKSMLSFLSSLPISVLRILDTEANK